MKYLLCLILKVKDIYSYGDYSVKSNETLKKITCIKDPDQLTFTDKTTNNIEGRVLSVVLSIVKTFKNRNFTNLEVYNGGTSVSDKPFDVFNKRSNTISDWGLEGRDPEITVATVRLFSIILKDPPKLTPETIQDQEVVFYLLNDFGGTNDYRCDGTYTSKDLSEVTGGKNIINKSALKM